MDLDVYFRALCKTVIGEAAELVGKEYRPTSSTGKLSVGSAGEFTSRFGMGQAQTGEFKGLLRLHTELEITLTNVDGDSLFTRKLAGSRKLEQTKSRGNWRSVPKTCPDLDGLTLNTIGELVNRIAYDYTR